MATFLRSWNYSQYLLVLHSLKYEESLLKCDMYCTSHFSWVNQLFEKNVYFVILFNVNVLIYQNDHFMRSWLESRCNLVLLRIWNTRNFSSSLVAQTIPLLISSAITLKVLLYWLNNLICGKWKHFLEEWVSALVFMHTQVFCTSIGGKKDSRQRVPGRKKSNTTDWRGYSEKDRRRLGLGNIWEKRF